jgi:transcriptional regulator with XRE-family HTH domain
MFKRKLLEVRLHKGLSQEEMADLTGMTQSNYSRREKGLTNISAPEWDKMAKVLGVKKEDIYETGSHHITDAIISKKNNSCKIHYFNVPDFVIEHIEFLKEENRELKEKLKKHEI